jgi:Zn-dependent oligopeptidase
MDEETLRKLVKKHKYNFKLIAEELQTTEERVRKEWTYLYCLEKNKPIPAQIQKEKNKLSSKYSPKFSIQEVTAAELLTSSRKRVNFLDHSDVDFTQQKSLSITGEEITPSGFCVLKHSLKETFKQIQERVLNFLPDIDDQVEDEENHDYRDFKVAIQGDEAVFQVKQLDEDWKSEVPQVPIPCFDDIQVIPESDRPKPRLVVN